jgi:hypothetical protein
MSLREPSCFFQHTTDVRAVIPVEKGLGILKKRLVSGWRIWIVTTGKEVFKETFCISPILTPCGVPCHIVAFDETRFTIKPVVPIYTTLDQVIGSSHDVFF